MIISALMAAAAVTNGEPKFFCNGNEVENLNPATMVHVRMQGALDEASGSGPNGAVSVASVPPAENSMALLRVGNGGAPYGYSRLRVSFTPCNAQQRDIVPEKRLPLIRYFFGKQADKVLKLKVTVKPLGVSSSTTLTSIHRKSSKTGEDWVTEVENDGVLLPYFRVDANSLVRIEADFQSTREYNSNISSESLGIIKRASALISPAAPLITAQNKDRFNDAANFVDSSINGLLKVSITEKPSLATFISPNGKKQPLAIVTLVAPWANDVYPERGGLIPVGQWTVWADELRASLLGVHNQNALVPGSYTASSVMNFSVSEEKTLKEALAGSSSVTAARDALITAKGEEATDAGRTFCRTIALETDALGLAPLDVGIATWAALTDLALPETEMGHALTACSKVENFPTSPGTPSS